MDWMRIVKTHKKGLYEAQRYTQVQSLKSPGIQCDSVSLCIKDMYSRLQFCRDVDANRIKANITTPLPGLKGPYGVIINIAQRQPGMLVLQVQRNGTGGSVNATSQIRITDEPGGSLLTYDANADLAALSP